MTGPRRAPWPTPRRRPTASRPPRPRCRSVLRRPVLCWTPGRPSALTRLSSLSCCGEPHLQLTTVHAGTGDPMAGQPGGEGEETTIRRHRHDEIVAVPGEVDVGPSDEREPQVEHRAVAGARDPERLPRRRYDERVALAVHLPAEVRQRLEPHRLRRPGV